jgi:hypothetical protein
VNRALSDYPGEWCLTSLPRISSRRLRTTVHRVYCITRDLAHARRSACVVSSDFGSLTCQVVCVDSQRSDFVLIPRGGWGILGCNVNVLTRDLVSKVGKGTPYYETRVRIEKLV